MSIRLDGPVLAFTLARVDPDRHRLRPRAGLARGAAGPQYRAEGGRPEHAGRGRFRQLAPAAAQPAGRRGGGAVADAARRRGPAGAQLRAPPGGHARLQPRARDLDAARRERPAVPETGGRGSSYFRQVGDRIAAVPGIKVRGAVSALPFTSSVGWGSINVEGWTPQPGQELQVDQRAATPDYFRTMEIPLVQGRIFSELRRAAERRARRHRRREVRAALLARTVRPSASTSGTIPSSR